MNYPNKRLSPEEEKAIETFVRRLRADFGQDLTDVRLYGSKARGEARSDSDLDILVLVTRSDYPLKHAILWLAAEISLAYNVLLSPRVVPPEAWRKMARANTLFFRAVQAEGISLHPPPSATSVTQN
jgi:predicted nucleotidyltransferase